MCSAFNDHQLPNNFGRQRNLGNLLTTKKNLAVLRERITFVFVNVSKPEVFYFTFVFLTFSTIY